MIPELELIMPPQIEGSSVLHESENPRWEMDPSVLNAILISFPVLENGPGMVLPQILAKSELNLTLDPELIYNKNKVYKAFLGMLRKEAK